MKGLGEVLQDAELKSVGKDKDYQAEPIKKSSNLSRSGQKQDPYVARATERAKMKIRDKIFQLNGDHVN